MLPNNYQDKMLGIVESSHYLNDEQRQELFQKIETYNDSINQGINQNSLQAFDDLVFELVTTIGECVRKSGDNQALKEWVKKLQEIKETQMNFYKQMVNFIDKAKLQT